MPEPTIAASRAFPLGCRPDRILLDNLKAQLPYSQAEIVYQAYGGDQALLVWYVEPRLVVGDPLENQILAAESAAAAARVLADASVCVAKFGLLHITVVAPDYMQWFSGAIHPEEIEGLAQTGSGGGPQGERGAGLVNTSAAPPELPGPEDCEWTSARQALGQAAESQGVPAVFWFVRDENGDNVFIAWTVAPGSDAVESLAVLEDLTGPLACLFPRPTGISVMVSIEEGPMLLTGYLPGRISQEGASFDLSELDYQELSPDE